MTSAVARARVERAHAADYLRQAAGGLPCGAGAAREALDAVQRGDLALAYALVRELQIDPAYQGNAVAACVDFARRALARAHVPELPSAGVQRLAAYRARLGPTCVHCGISEASHPDVCPHVPRIR